jgi:starch phosphorylase
MSQPLLPRVAFFCMEYGLARDLPIYAGGLGILAGDLLKAAADLHLPVVGVGIFWSEGYSVQRVGADGHMVDEFPATPRQGLVPTGALVEVQIRGRNVPVTAWRLDRPGVATIYLLEPVAEADGWITRRLYGGGGEERVAQEILLGVGGARILAALGVEAERFHFNEGHAVFAGLELIRARVAAGASFADAWRAVRRQVVFTTHTPVAAGNEAHRLDLLGDLGLDRAELEAIGGDPFSMTVAGLRLSSVTNAVSELHARTARRMWAEIGDGASIVAVSNGVHPPTWQDERMRVAYAHGTVWETHQRLKRELLDEVRARTGVALAEDRLLVGFARRAAAYKRSDLLLRDMSRVGPLLAARRLQVIFAGKAHPHDELGKRILANLVAAARRHPDAVVFLENHDLRLGQLLTRGCDVWLNTPRRPMEASGTSGMKAAMNGVLNLSVLDGWWPEACAHGRNGWQLGDGFEGPGQDEHDLAALYDVLEGEVIPAYYDDRPRWVGMMRAAIETAQWRFSSYRTLEDYYRHVYSPSRAAG